jgi:A/G-specific adenine glycosylase
MNDSASVARRLLPWYDRNRRDLPWRAPPGTRADPYRVWLSEIMLQQTTVTAAAPYFLEFLRRWPSVSALAAAPLDDVLAAWAGLGYYARARNLHACAKAVAALPGARFPDGEAALLELPGIGAYTAAAVAAIAFDQPATVVDGNVERVVARLFEVGEPLPAAKPRLRALARTLTPTIRPGDFAQAMMDLGAMVCVPRSPRCLLCPLAEGCAANANGTAADLPRRADKPDRPTRFGTAFWLVNPAGEILLRRRPPSGLLGGMTEVPSTPWTEGEAPDHGAHAPLAVAWRPLPGSVRHVFSHFALELRVLAGRAGDGWQGADGFWVPPSSLGRQALPSVMRKVVKLAEGWNGAKSG